MTRQHSPSGVALVMGGARMGQAVGQSLHRSGYHVVFTWRSSRQAALQAVETLRAAGGSAEAMRCDLSRTASLRKLVATLQRRHRRLDLLVNLASIYETTPPGDATRSWDEHMNANARGAYLVSRLAAPLLRKARPGRIIHISDWTSVSGRPRYKEYSAYYVSKAAVKASVEALALELAPDVLVNGIAPGPMLAPAGMSAREHAAVKRATPLNQWGGAEEIAKAVDFLAATNFVTGEVIRVDGGRHLI